MRYSLSIYFAAIIAFILMFVAVFGSTQIEPWKNALTGLVCGSGEAFTSSSTQHSKTETHTSFLCMDKAGHTRDVTGGVFAASCGLSFLFFVGLTLIFVLLSFIFVRSRPADLDVSPSDQTPLASPQARRPAVDTAFAPLVARLQQVQEALNQGLISQDEYERSRRAILDRMSN